MLLHKLDQSEVIYSCVLINCTCFLQYWCPHIRIFLPLIFFKNNLYLMILRYLELDVIKWMYIVFFIYGNGIK